ncbi:MAG: NAD-dependent epimerase/dehydratase family protein [Rhodothermales bacterium]|nr:NAD-dependent epimerase/dehydratase family protein [Rhodothermales bacterium]
MDQTPHLIENEDELDEFMSRPQPRVIEMMSRLSGDIIILGVGGKMGVSLAEQAARAIREAGSGQSVIGVSRFSDPAARSRLETSGVQTIACDLLNPDAVSRLPVAPNVIFMAGRKFGTDGDQGLTWAMNTTVPAIVSHRFGGCRMVVFSTGCVYPFVSPDTGGCSTSTPTSPVGEYAQSCLGRERVFEHFSLANGTPTCIIRLNYAIDLRYGVLHDITASLLDTGSVDVSMGYFNIIWQGDANAIALLQLENCASPANVINLTGASILSTRDVASEIARALDIDLGIESEEQPTAYLNDASATLEAFGGTTVDVETMIRWNAHWQLMGGRSLSRPTHFEVKDGTY